MYSNRIEVSDESVLQAEAVHVFSEGKTQVGVSMDVLCDKADAVEVLLSKSEILEMLERINEEEGIEYTYTEEEIEED